MEKAIIIKTGEEVTIAYRTYPITMRIGTCIDGTFESYDKIEAISHREEMTCVLTNGQEFSSDELVIGDEEIKSYLRDKKIRDISNENQ